MRHWLGKNTLVESNDCLAFRELSCPLFYSDWALLPIWFPKMRRWENVRSERNKPIFSFPHKDCWDISGLSLHRSLQIRTVLQPQHLPDIQNNPQQKADTQSGFSAFSCWEVSQQYGMLWLHPLVELVCFISVSDLMLWCSEGTLWLCSLWVLRQWRHY